MNQIIYPEKLENNLIIYKDAINQKKKIYSSLFIFSVIALIAFFCYYIFLYFRLSKVEKTSKNILEIYDIQQLYTSNTPISLPSVVLENGESTDIIGIISIDKINLRYPILSTTTDEFLEIAPCKFYGGNINSYGNFCIAGHNYDNGELFSNLYLLEVGDMIEIYELNRKLSFLYYL